MKQAQAMQDNLKKAQDELAFVEVEGQAGSGMVKVLMTCKHNVRRVTIDPSLLAAQGIRAVFKSPGLSPVEVAGVWQAAQAKGLWCGTELTLFAHALEHLKNSEVSYQPKVLAISDDVLHKRFGVIETKHSRSDKSKTAG